MPDVLAITLDTLTYKLPVSKGTFGTPRMAIGVIFRRSVTIAAGFRPEVKFLGIFMEALILMVWFLGVLH